eukprot:CAMPEP_0174734316 /NCGR_PEP_ID=MMETSP1094-20130205/63084_1 /TAXON_ID=156173 /ORGANISM="Chrysochromulina brevifilum, Strain UTEX LB 985" /LENGTH=248 /DNA_ID=CAMNT_0015937117 /DNA_START=95 /DNA_END=838 /DNA_ORIENTATION=-
MPRKQAAAATTPASNNETVEGNESYLDNFLASITEDVNLPGDIKRNLTQLRELDQQSQELFERMQRLSKNHIARAKRSVQDGREPDEEYLTKARKTYRELMEVDEEKVQVADQIHSDITRHYDHCSSELRKFEEELKEKGQLKTPQMKTTAPQMKTNTLSRQESSEQNADAPTAAGGPSVEPPPAPAVGGQRGRQGSSSGVEAAVSAPPPSANSHKRGRGRKVSFKEAERQRLAAESAAASSAAADDG